MSLNKLTEDEFSDIYEKNLNSIYVLCYSYMGNKSDAEDAAQETFIRLIKYGNRFESDEHIKAWLIVTAMNVCKTMLKHWTKQKRDDSREVIDIPDTVSEKNYELIQNILELPEKYKTVIYMYYYEGFSTSEISDFLKISESSVRSRLARGRNILKEDITLSNKEVYEWMI